MPLKVSANVPDVPMIVATGRVIETVGEDARLSLTGAAKATAKMLKRERMSFMMAVDVIS